MFLRNITIEDLGAVDHLTYDFSDKFNLLKTVYTEEIAYAIRLVLNHKSVPPLPTNAVRVGTRIRATVYLDQKHYEISITPSQKPPRFVWRVYDAGALRADNEYLYLTDHCEEQDLSDVFDGGERQLLLRVLEYANEDLYYAPRELSRQTAGASELGAFRAYLRDFIDSFESETIREKRHHEIILEKNGRYVARNKLDGDRNVTLSESERTLFRYLCFLHTAEFWQGFEDMRNLNGIRKPLVIKDLLERLDESVDVSELLERSLQLGRQMIVLQYNKGG